MYGSYPEVTITARYLSAFIERLKYFSLKTPKLKNTKFLKNTKKNTKSKKHHNFWWTRRNTKKIKKHQNFQKKTFCALLINLPHSLKDHEDTFSKP